MIEDKGGLGRNLVNKSVFITNDRVAVELYFGDFNGGSLVSCNFELLVRNGCCYYWVVVRHNGHEVTAENGNIPNAISKDIEILINKIENRLFSIIHNSVYKINIMYNEPPASRHSSSRKNAKNYSIGTLL